MPTMKKTIKKPAPSAGGGEMKPKTKLIGGKKKPKTRFEDLEEELKSSQGTEFFETKEEETEREGGGGELQQHDSRKGASWFSPPPEPAPPKDVPAMLRILATADDIEQALQMISYIDTELAKNGGGGGSGSPTLAPAGGGGDESTVGGMSATSMGTLAAEQIFDLQGLAVMMSSLRQFQDSPKFVGMAARCLVHMTHNEEKFRRILVNLGLVDTLRAIAKKHPSSYFIHSNLVGLLHNICCGEHDRSSVVTDDYILFVMNTMKKYPTKPYVNAIACGYFEQLIKIPDAKKRLLKNQIFLLMAGVYETFRHMRTSTDVAGDVTDANMPAPGLVQKALDRSKSVLTKLLDATG